MPQIREYISQVRPVGPQDFARANEENFGSSVGRGLQQLAGGVDVVADTLKRRQESDEMMRAKLELMKVKVEAQNQLRDSIQKGNLNYDEFKNRFSNRLSDVRNGLGLSSKNAQNFFDLESSELNAYIDTKSFDAEANIKGMKARFNFEEFAKLGIQSISNDPSIANLENINTSLDLLLDQKVQNEGLPFEQAEILKKSGRGKNLHTFLNTHMDVNPYAAKANLASGKWDHLFSSDDNKATWSHAIDKMIKTKEHEEEKALEKRQLETSDQLFSEYVERSENETLDGGEFIKKIMDSDIPTYGVGGKNWFLSQVDKTAKAQLKRSDPSVFNTFYQNIHADADNPNRIINPQDVRKQVGKGLTAKDAEFLIKQIKVSRGNGDEHLKTLMKAFDERARNLIVKKDVMTGIEDPKGLALYAQFIQAKHQYVQQMYEKGMSMNEIFNPGNPDSLYHKVDINPYVRSLNERISDQFNTDKNATPIIGKSSTESIPDDEKKRPDESDEEFFERLQRKGVL